MRASAGALAVHTALILAGCHVRASAGDLAVHGALIPCVCVCVSVRYQTPFSSRHESGPSWFLSTGKHPVGGQLPRVFFSALPGQSSDRPNLPPHKKLSIFQFPFASIWRATSEACSGLGKRRIDRLTSKRSSKKLQRAAITSFFLDRSLVVACIVTGHDQSMHCPLFSRRRPSQIPSIKKRTNFIDNTQRCKRTQIGLDKKNIVKWQFKAFHKARKNPGLKLGFKAFIAF